VRRLGAPAPDVRGSGKGSGVVIVLVVCLALGGLAAVAVDRFQARDGAGQASLDCCPRRSAVPPGLNCCPRQSAAVPGYNCCARTPAGAAGAVGSYLSVLGGALALNPSAASTTLDQIADPGARAQLESGLAASRQVEEGLWGVQSAIQQGKQVVLTQTPIAYRVTSYSDQVATVAVWLVTTVGVENRQRLAAFFGNGSATVAWLDGAWRLRAIANGSAAGDVVPACLQTPTPTGGVPAQLDGFVPYGS
jgi:hypothetical protein